MTARPGTRTNDPDGRRRRRAVACAALAGVVGALCLTVPANAANGSRRPSTTTTTAKATTTTKAPTTTTTTSTASAASPCGTAKIPKATGGSWECTWADSFDGPTLDRSKWLPQTTAASGFTTGPACFVDNPNNLSVANGVLSLTARKEAKAFTCTDPVHGSFSTRYTSGMVSTYGLFSQAYGRFEVRAKLPAAKIAGLQESFWLWPVDVVKYGSTWPWSGEIDIAEIYSKYPDRAIPYVHYVPAATDPNVTNTSCLITDISQFHTYAVEWTTSAITVIYDGKTCLVDTWNPASPLTKPQPFDQPFMIALTQALGIGDNAFNPTKTPLPATTQVDYVRVWK